MEIYFGIPSMNNKLNKLQWLHTKIMFNTHDLCVVFCCVLVVPAFYSMDEDFSVEELGIQNQIDLTSSPNSLYELAIVI